MTFGGTVRSIANNILETLFPLRCSGCGKEGSFLCYACISQFESAPQVIIPHNFSLDKIVSIFKYKNPLDTCIISGKYNFYPEIFSELASLMAQRLPLEFGANSVFCPIPLSRQRLRWRGFNQSEILCRALSQQLGTPWKNLLTRPKHTATQKDLSRAKRITNMSRAFQALTPLTTGHTIILIDDVVTTGTTLQSAATVLLSAGAQKVSALTIAAD